MDRQALHLSEPILVSTLADAAGGAVSNAEVRAIYWTAPPTVVQEVTDADGRFELWLPAGAITLSAHADSYAPAQVFATAPSDDVELALTPGGSIRGRTVAAGQGAPVAGATVRAVPVGMPVLATQRVGVSRSDGEFALEGLEPNRYEVTAEADGGRSRESVVVSVGLGEAVAGVELALAPATRVAARVVDVDGEVCSQGSVVLAPPSPGARATLSQSEAEVTAAPLPLPTLVSPIEPDGAIRFGGVPPGRYAVQVNCTDPIASADPIGLAVGNDDIEGLEWRVRSGIGLSVDVVDARRRPVPRAQFAIAAPDPSGGTNLMPYTADLKGHCEVPPVLEAGTYRIGPHGGAEGEPVEVVLEEGMGSVEVELELAGSGAVEVETQTPDGTPLSAGLLVNAHPTSQAPQLATAIAGAQVGLGRYRIGPLPEGEYRIEVSDGINPPFGFRA